VSPLCQDCRLERIDYHWWNSSLINFIL
jgi:hypothetical protein